VEGGDPTELEARTQDAPVVIAVAASAGGLHALIAVLSPLAPDLPAAVVVVLHHDPRYESHLEEIFTPRLALRVARAEAGQRPAAGTVYVFPADRQLTMSPDGSFALQDYSAGTHPHPSADALFQSLARHSRARLIAVVLTGTGHDGARGVTAVKQAGGTVIAQDEAAEHFAMPEAAIRTDTVDHIVPLAEMAPLLAKLASA